MAIGRTNAQAGGGSTGSVSKPPEYTYTGSSEFVDETEDGSAVNWHLKLKTSGVLFFNKLNNAKNGLEVFLVGGGGSSSGQAGGGGGYTLSTEFAPEQTTEYNAVIGAGGNASDGGNTSIFGFKANGGKGTPNSGYHGCDGGSGGGADSWAGHSAGAGGTNGGNGANGTGGGDPYLAGKGAGITTIPWENKTLYGIYSGGGGGGNGGLGTATGSIAGGNGGEGGGGRGGDGQSYGTKGSDGKANTGGGAGGAGCFAINKGGSGIILIRNKRA